MSLVVIILHKIFLLHPKRDNDLDRTHEEKRNKTMKQWLENSAVKIILGSIMYEEE